MNAKILTDEDLMLCLCSYDPRNPIMKESIEIGVYDDEDLPKPREDCWCDSCFYGRDILALEIIRLREKQNARLIEKAPEMYPLPLDD